MKNICVIGAGASGLIAALTSSDNNKVTLIEANNKLGKKMLLTGNGKCNYWNSNIFSKYYHTDNYGALDKILERKDNTLEYLTNLGIVPNIKNGLYYPNSNQASTIVELLKREIYKRNIDVILECKVDKIIKEEDIFIVSTNLGEYKFDEVIISCGGLSYPKTGSDGSGFKLLEKYHTINKTLPALVPLVTSGDFLKDWANIRVDGKVSLYIDNNLVDSEIGEIQLTDYGVSGIAIFNISGDAIRGLNDNKKIEIKINFLNEIDNFYDWFNERNKNISNHTIYELLETVLPYQLISVLLKETGIKETDTWDNMDNSLKNKLSSLIEEFTLEVNSYLDFDRSQVTTGGVSLNEIDANTMESLNVDGLYLAGEILDVDGKCGGYNLGFAFISGYIAGLGVNND